MKPKKVLILLIIILISAFILMACSRSPATNSPVGNTSVPQETTGATTQETTTQEPSGTTSATDVVPEDVPIMPDAYDIQVSNNKNLMYKVNAKITDAVAFYQEEFPKFGWDVANNPDSVVGNMAQISRSNAKGDRLVFSFQYNPISEFTVVQIFITRK